MSNPSDFLEKNNLWFLFRYYSNEYPKAEIYRFCNWCLSQRVDSEKKAQSSPNSSSSSKNSTDRDESLKKKNKDSEGGIKGKKGNLPLQIIKPVKKQRSPEHSPASTGRKRITTIGVLEERQRLRRSKSMDLTKHVFKSKVRRYKLLNEVSI